MNKKPSPPTHRATTLKDIAVACGVSEATVSYVVNGKRKLRADTRENVFRAMRELNYHPNAVARGLAQKRVHMLGVLFGHLDPKVCLQDAYMAAVLAGVMTRAQESGFNIALFTEPWANRNADSMSLRDGRTDGILALAPALDSGILEGLAQLGMPAVAVAGATNQGVSVVDIDNRAGARLATEHLIGLGHRRIAYLGAPETHACAQPRRQGFVEALTEAGIEVREDWLCGTNFDADLARQQVLALLALPQPPTAFFAANDLTALCVLEAARSFGARVPEDLSVVGFDDVPTASLAHPPLTTVRQPLLALGETAASLLIESICNPDQAAAPQCVLLAPELIVRESSARAKPGA